MALTNNQMAMIEYISKNDLSMAKKAALACLVEDSSKKNESKVSYYTRILQSSSLSMVQLPVDIAGFADLEDLSSYNEKRYYITSRESKLFEQVSKMHKVSLTLMEKQIPYLNATLLYGESGVGKTAFSRYTAYKLGLPYLYINFSRLIESYLGKTSKNISHLFDFIKKNQCLVMFDEIDCIAASRRYGGGAESELARSTTTLIQLLDGISNDHVIFAATGASYGTAADTLWEIEGRPDWYYDRSYGKKKQEFSLSGKDAEFLGIHIPRRIKVPVSIKDTKVKLQSGMVYDNSYIDGYLINKSEPVSWKDFMTEEEMKKLVLKKIEEKTKSLENQKKLISFIYHNGKDLPDHELVKKQFEEDKKHIDEIRRSVNGQLKDIA